jgi:hypothetical protein
VIAELVAVQVVVSVGRTAPELGDCGAVPPRAAVGWLMYEPPFPLLIVMLEIFAPTLKVVLYVQALAPFPIVNEPVPPL